MDQVTGLKNSQDGPPPLPGCFLDGAWRVRTSVLRQTWATPKTRGFFVSCVDKKDAGVAERKTGLLAGGAFAPYKRFAKGKTLAQGQFTCPEYLNRRRVEAAKGRRNPKRKT